MRGRCGDKSKAYLTFRKVCVFSKVLEIMELTLLVVKGPMGGDRVKWPSRQIRAAAKHRSSMVSPPASGRVSPDGSAFSEICVMELDSLMLLKPAGMNSHGGSGNAMREGGCEARQQVFVAWRVEVKPEGDQA